jgi:hypothetical protein
MLEQRKYQDGIRLKWRELDASWVPRPVFVLGNRYCRRDLSSLLMMILVIVTLARYQRERKSRGRTMKMLLTQSSDRLTNTMAQIRNELYITVREGTTIVVRQTTYLRWRKGPRDTMLRGGVRR